MIYCAFTDGTPAANLGLFFSFLAGVPVDQLVNERQNTADLLAAALAIDEDEDIEQGQSLQSTDALQSLLATAAEGPSEPFIPEYDDVVEEQPIIAPAQIPRRQPLPAQAEAPRRVPSGRTRRPPSVPRRVRPRPDNEKKGQRQPNRPAGDDAVGTVERYSHTNEDGSFTFGYIAEDGSFREETRGVDCITRGKYGYIDPDGKKREFTYVSGLPCDIGDEEQPDEENTIREDPINPNDRFRTSAAVQLSEDEIPASARPRQRNPQIPQRQPQIPQRQPAPRPQPRPVAPQQPQQQFSAFQQQPQRAPVTAIRDPALRNRAPVQPAQPVAQQGGALQNLFNIVGDQPVTPLPPRPQPTPAPALRPVQEQAVTRPRTQPQTPRPSPIAPAPRPSAFDFDSELDSFTLNKPAISFDEPAPAAQEEAAKPNFSTELVFDPASGTFKTELRQALPGGEEVRVSNDAAPSGAAAASPKPTLPPTPAPTPANSALFTAFSPTTLRPTTPRPQSPRPSPTPSPSPSPRPVTQAAVPITASSPFTPLTFPSPAPTSPRPATPAPEAPRAAQPASPRPTLAASPRPTTLAATPRPTTLAASPSPSPTLRQQGSPTPPPSGSFFFQPFPTVGSPRPITATSPAPAQPRPAIGQPGRLPANAGQSNAGFPAGTFPIATQPQARPPPGFGGQPLGQPARPPPGFAQTPRPTAAAPRPSPSLAPQQPTPQARPVPFTVFNTNFQPQTQTATLLGASPRPASVPEQPRAIQGTPAPANASPSPAPGTPAPRPVAASPSPTPIQFSASPTPIQLSPRPVTPTPGSAATPQVQFGFQPITQQVASQPSQRPPAQFQQRPPPGFVQVQRPQPPPRPVQGQPPRPVQGQPPRPGQPQQRPANAPFTAFASGPPPQLAGQRPPTNFFGQPQVQGRPQQLGIPPQLAQQQQQPGRFQPFGRPPPQGQPQARPPPRPSSPFTVFNPNLLRGARFF